MKVLFITLLFSVSHIVNAGQVSLLKLENEVVSFSIVNSKLHILPACAAQEQSNLWAFSLGSSSGRAMYSMLVTAVAANINIFIEPALRCDVPGIEAPKSVAFGSESNVPVNTAVYASCNEILQNVPSAQDGFYTLFVGVGQMKVYCDMDWETGGWALVMRGKEGDYVGWNSTDFVNFTETNLPNGSTFKLSDNLINELATQAYKVELDDGQIDSIRYFKGGCKYIHTVGRAVNECSTSYSNLNWESPTSGEPPTKSWGKMTHATHSVWNSYDGCGNYFYESGGLSDVRQLHSTSGGCTGYGHAFIGTIGRKYQPAPISEYSWVIGTGRNSNFKVAGDENPIVDTTNDLSFTVWVK